MDFENIPKVGSEQENIKLAFVNALTMEVAKLVEDGRLDQKEADEKISAGELIETNFSDNVEKDAKIFAISGIADEEELISEINKSE